MRRFGVRQRFYAAGEVSAICRREAPGGASEVDAEIPMLFASCLSKKRSIQPGESSRRRIGSRRRDPHAFRVLQISKKCLIRRRANASLVCRKGKTLHVSRETLDFPPVYVKMLVCCRVFAGSLCFFKGVLLNG